MTHCILVAEDDPAIRELLKAMLEHLRPNASVVLAESAERALALFDAQGYSLVITDLDVPQKESGFRVLRGAVALGIPVLVMTGRGDDESVPRRARDAGASGFLSKPFTRNEFKQLLNLVLPIAS